MNATHAIYWQTARSLAHLTIPTFTPHTPQQIREAFLRAFIIFTVRRTWLEEMQREVYSLSNSLTLLKLETSIRYSPLLEVAEEKVTIRKEVRLVLEQGDRRQRVVVTPSERPIVFLE